MARTYFLSGVLAVIIMMGIAGVGIATQQLLCALTTERTCECVDLPKTPFWESN